MQHNIAEVYPCREEEGGGLYNNLEQEMQKQAARKPVKKVAKNEINKTVFRAATITLPTSEQRNQV